MKTKYVVEFKTKDSKPFFTGSSDGFTDYVEAVRFADNCEITDNIIAVRIVEIKKRVLKTYYNCE